MPILDLHEMYVDGMLGYLLEKKWKAELRKLRKSEKTIISEKTDIQIPPNQVDINEQNV